MTAKYLGEIRMFAGKSAPAGWELCEGQLLPIAEYKQLFGLIGTSYGGDGASTFALPDLRGRIPVHQGDGLILAQAGGSETVKLTIDQIPAHNHALRASQNVAQSPIPSGKVAGQTGGSALPYFQGVADTDMSSQAISITGNGRPHNNLAPFLCVNFIIALAGSLPST